MTRPTRPLPLFLARSLKLPDPNPWMDTRSRLVSRIALPALDRVTVFCITFPIGGEVVAPISSNVVAGGACAAIPGESDRGPATPGPKAVSEDGSCAGIDIRTRLPSIFPAGDPSREP